MAIAPRRFPSLVLSVLAVTSVACAGLHGVPPEMWTWNRPFPPHRVAGNLYFVGHSDLAIFLVRTPAGHVLIDSGFEESVPRLANNVRALGLRFEDIKILLTTHAHIDHVQGHAAVRRLTGARVLVSKADAPVVASGGRGDYLYEGTYAWPPCPVDGLVEDGDRVELGGVVLTAHLTPGHTRGATTWTLRVARENNPGRPLDVVIFPSANVNPGTRLVGNKEYPSIADDYAKSFGVWRALPCDVFLGSHGSFYGLAAKHDATLAGRSDAFVDPEGFRRLVAEQEARFKAILESQR